MTAGEFMERLWDGWTVVALIILALMVCATVREEWTSPEGSRFEVALGVVLIAVGIYLGGFR